MVNMYAIWAANPDLGHRGGYIADETILEEGKFRIRVTPDFNLDRGSVAFFSYRMANDVRDKILALAAKVHGKHNATFSIRTVQMSDNDTQTLLGRGYTFVYEKQTTT